MTISEYQKFVRKGASVAYDRELALIGLVGEIGEVADVIKKMSIYPNASKFTEKYKMTPYEKLADELGDVLWQLVNLMNMCCVDIEDIMCMNVRKLIERHGGEGKTAEDGGGNRE